QSRPADGAKAYRRRPRGIGILLARGAYQAAERAGPAVACDLVSGPSAHGSAPRARAPLRQRSLPLALPRRQQERHAALGLHLRLRQSREGTPSLRPAERSLSGGYETPPADLIAARYARTRRARRLLWPQAVPARTR